MVSEDIVTRLRELREVLMGNPIMAREVQEAMDEIERLQSLVEHLSAQLRLQMKANDKAWEAYKEVAGDEY